MQAHVDQARLKSQEFIISEKCKKLSTFFKHTRRQKWACYYESFPARLNLCRSKG